MCPFCRNPQARIKKKGWFPKATTRAQRIQRFYCHGCRRTFSTQTGTMTYREKKPHVNQEMFRLICSSVSQRRTARLVGVQPVTIARKITKMARFARRQHEATLIKSRGDVTIMFDEMETFEHTKCKPLSIAVAVHVESKEVLAATVSRMPAKGRLAALSRRKYGPREDHRKYGLRRVMEVLRKVSHDPIMIKADQNPFYPGIVKKYFPSTPTDFSHSRKPCVVGYGEMKAGGRDPLFKINQTCAMFRDNIKRLARRTWCTTKSPGVLQDILDLYICFHNDLVGLNNRLIAIEGGTVM